MARLVPAVRRALNDAAIRRAAARARTAAARHRRHFAGLDLGARPRRQIHVLQRLGAQHRSATRRRKCSAPTPRSTCTPEDLAALDFAMHTLGANQRTATNLQARWRHRNGSYRWLERNMLVLLGEGGQVTGFRGSERDFTERRRQEKHISRLTRVLKMLSRREQRDGAHPPAARDPRRGLPPRHLGRRIRERDGGAHRARHAHGASRRPGRAASTTRPRSSSPSASPKPRRTIRASSAACCAPAHRWSATTCSTLEMSLAARAPLLDCGIPQRRRLSTARGPHAGRRADAHLLRRRRRR